MRSAAALLAAVALGLGAAPSAGATEVVAHLATTASGRKVHDFPPSVIWLQPAQPDGTRAMAPGRFTLLQKNKAFVPHLLVVPVGSSVSFPNGDPFFHNVFSLFDGRRFDLGLYEAGSTRSVVFSREGVSYIFCNIHSEMSAVVLSLSTPYVGIADARGELHLKDVPQGEYRLHVWVEGRSQRSLEQYTRAVRVAGSTLDLGPVQIGPPEALPHLNKFGQPYAPDPRTTY